MMIRNEFLDMHFLDNFYLELPFFWATSLSYTTFYLLYFIYFILLL